MCIYEFIIVLHVYTLIDDRPFSRIGLPYYREQLLSAWSNLPAYEVGDPPSKIDPVILKTARQNEVGFWSPNPRKGQRNLAEKKRIPEESGNLLNAPKFLSEKARETEREAQADNEVDDLQDQLSEALIGNVTKTEVPIMYRNVEIKYSRFGVDDFDFQYVNFPQMATDKLMSCRFYNRTKFSGLETHIANSYTNPLLQLFKFIPLFRNLALQHTATSCLFDTCLLCELGYLFDTMEKAEGQSCQATNFLKTFSSIPQTNRMALLEENNPNSALGDMIQAACRFLLAQARDDFLRNGPAANQFDQILAVDALTSIQCVHCRNETIKSAGGNITDLIYTPLHSPGRGQRLFIPTFSQILKASVEVQTQTRGWCDKCRRYQQLATRKGVRKMPDILMINTALKSAEAKQYWGIPGWLPDSIGIVIDEGKFFCFEGEDLRLHIQKGLHIVKVYDLVGIVVDIVSAGHQKSHLVSIINVDVFTDKDGLTANWHLFNDFLVRKLSKDEGLTYPPSWKVPTVIAYQITAARGQVDSTWKENLDTSLLYNNWSINNQPPENCEILDPAVEAPCAGTFLAVDTEFVSLQHQEIEIKADGNREVVRPTRLGLARVSVLRGAGYQEGVPFINDYITIREDIVDYLTQYSGVAEGDLDPRYSPHNLVTLKVAYKKLWLLVNLGCIFVGHGLPKDFRTVNIHVPRHQVLDTVDLFYIKSRQRKLSLRYLAWYLLKEDIQQDTHDSIEDARTALRLWRKYEEFCDAGIVEPMLEEIYREGKKWGYRPPGEAIVQGGHRISRNAATGDLLHVPTVAGIGPSSLDGRETPDLGMSVPGSPGRRIESVRRVDGFDSPMR